MLQRMPTSQPTEIPLRQRAGGRIMVALGVLARPARSGPFAGFRMTPSRLAVWIATGAVAFVVIMALVDPMLANGARRLPRWIVTAFNEITDYGKSGWFLWPLGVALLALAAVPANLTRAAQLVTATIAVRAGFLFAAIAAPSLFVTIIKRLIGRARPFVTGIADPFVFTPFAWRVEYSSLPSGHATTAVAVAVAVSTLWPRTRTVMWIYAALIMASRVVISAHYPTDVLAGALVGAGGAMLVRRYFASRRLGFAIAADGSVVHFPGPSLRRTKAVARALLAE